MAKRAAMLEGDILSPAQHALFQVRAAEHT